MGEACELSTFLEKKIIIIRNNNKLYKQIRNIVNKVNFKVSTFCIKLIHLNHEVDSRKLGTIRPEFLLSFV